MGGTGAHPLVDGAGSCPSSVFGGVCELRMTLGSLSFDGRGCVPTLLIVWPEVSLHWSLQAVGWGQVSVPKWWPLVELTSMTIPWGLCHHCPCPHSEPQLTPTSPGDPPRSVGRSGPGFYRVIALLWVSVHRTTCVSSKSGISVSPSPALKPHWPSKPNALGAPPSDGRPSGWGVWCGSQNSHSCGRTSAM